MLRKRTRADQRSRLFRKGMTVPVKHLSCDKSPSDEYRLTDLESESRILQHRPPPLLFQYIYKYIY